MISHDDAERRIANWLEATPASSAVEVLADTFRMTRRTSQVSALRARLQPARFAWMGAAAAVAVAVVVGAFTFELPRAGAPAPTGHSLVVAQRWVTNADVAVTVHHDADDDVRYYWRGAVYDRITSVGFDISDARNTIRPPQTAILQGTADDFDPGGLHQVTLTVQPASFTSPFVLSPAWPLHVDQRTQLTTVGQNGYFANLQRDGTGPYTLTALVAGQGGSSGGAAILSGGVPILRTADPSYPAALVNTYTQLPPGTIGPNLSALRDEVVRTAASPGPYDLANRIVAILQSSRFTYDTDVRDVDCGSMSVAECFATSRRGYCEHFAMTMIVLLRDLRIPSRLVEGFLPGTLDQRTGTETIYNYQAHAWVEVYFTGAGWVAFDPTPGAPSP
jgi:hypothetical protein